jgi:hypothetical protein
MACVEAAPGGQRLPFGIEVVGFAEEEGQRYKATFLGSGALTGHFNPAWLDQKDADGITMREAMQQAGLGTLDIPKLQRDPAQYLGFVEVHIEQGPVLNELNLPLGVVTSINGSVRYLGEVVGMASHAGTTPMDRRARRRLRRGRADAVRRAARRADGDSVATVGMLQVPGGSINVVPGRCQFSLDLRAPTNAQRDALVRDVLAQLRMPFASAAACATHSKKPCAPPPRPAPPRGKPAGTAAVTRWACPAPHAQRRRARRHEAARNHAAGHAVRARRKQRHQPQPARVHHQRRHGPGRARLFAPAATTAA